MKLGLNLSQRPDLQLRLSPQILQRIEVLQLQALDLVQLIEQELQVNETLELSDDGESEPADAESDEWEDSYDDLEREERPTRDREAPTRMDVMEATAAAPVTLQDHLRKQLNEPALPWNRALSSPITASPRISSRSTCRTRRRT